VSPEHAVQRVLGGFSLESKGSDVSKKTDSFLEENSQFSQEQELLNNSEYPTYRRLKEDFESEKKNDHGMIDQFTYGTGSEINDKKVSLIKKSDLHKKKDGPDQRDGIKKEINTIDEATKQEDSLHCSGCKRIFSGEYFYYEGEDFCYNCYKARTLNTCETCGKLVEGEGVIMEEKEGSTNREKRKKKVYHQECLNCSYCSKAILGKFFKIGDSVVCNSCAKLEGGHDACHACGQEVAGDCVLSDGKTFHPLCMKCSVCGDILSQQFFSQSGQLLCEADYHRIVGSCARCGQAAVGKIFQVASDVYHQDCLTCCVCDDSLVGVPFSVDDDQKIYCQDDFNRLYATHCSVCSRPIVPKKGESTASRIKALGRDFHPWCFVCDKCGEVLGEEFYHLHNKPYCLSCRRSS